jgi:MATE family multidrug resistance protein
MTSTLPKSPAEWHRKVVGLSSPLILANLTIPLVGAVDTAVMGRLPDPAYIGAVAVGATILSSMYWLFGFLRMGTTGLSAQAYGASDMVEVLAIGARAAMIAALLGTALIALQVPLKILMLMLFPASEAVEQGAATYFSIRIWGSLPLFLHLVQMGMLFGLQRMRATLVLSLTMNVSNVILDLLFVVGLGMQVEGVAYASLVSEWIAVLVGWLLLKQALPSSALQQFKANLRARLFDRDRLLSLFDVSSNLILRTFCVQLPFFAFTALGSGLGDTTLAANAILMQLFFFMTYGLDGIAHSAEALAGYAYGAGSPRQLRNTTIYTGIWATGLALVIATIYGLAADGLIALFTTSTEIRAHAAEYSGWLILAPIVCVWAFQFDGIFIGTTQMRELRNTMLIAVLIYGATIALTYKPLANHGLWLAMSVFMLSRSLLLAWRYPRVEAKARSLTQASQGLGLAHHPVQMVLIAKALSIDLVDIFGAGWSCSKPAAAGSDFDTTYGCIIPWRVGQDIDNFFTCQCLCCHLI